MKVLSISTVLISFVIMLNACKKENAKEKYVFRLEFSSGDVWEKECYLFEKHKRNKRYEKSGVEEVVDLKRTENVIYTDALKGETVLYKVNDRILNGASNANLIVSDFSMLNHQSGLMQGFIELEGDYEQHRREYQVENGTFKFQLHGALYNMPDSVYTGKWTLKRK